MPTKGVFGVVRDLMAEIGTADAWLVQNPYFVEVVRKFRTDVGALRRHAQDIVSACKEGTGSPLSRLVPRRKAG